jgi:hypothetical protein
MLEKIHLEHELEILNIHYMAFSKALTSPKLSESEFKVIKAEFDACEVKFENIKTKLKNHVN